MANHRQQQFESKIKEHELLFYQDPSDQFKVKNSQQQQQQQKMSAPANQAPFQPQDIPAQVQSVVKNVFHRFSEAKMQVRPLIEDLITFVSIIGAFQYVSFSYEQGSRFQKWTRVQLSNKRTQAILLLIFAIYLITLKLIYKLAHKYETAPPKKIIPDNWQQLQQTQQPQLPPVSTALQQLPLPPNSYSLLVKQLINNSVYGFVFMFCTTAYAYISMFNKSNFWDIEGSRLVNIEQVNYLIFWFVTANIFYSVGKLVGKVSGVKTFHHFGFVVGLFVLVIEIGLAHGFNTFIFI